MSSSKTDEATPIDILVDDLFTGSFGKADRLLLIQESHNGAAPTTNPPTRLSAEELQAIRAFNPAPDDVVTRLASPVHDEEPKQ